MSNNSTSNICRSIRLLCQRVKLLTLAQHSARKAWLSKQHFSNFLFDPTLTLPESGEGTVAYWGKPPLLRVDTVIHSRGVAAEGRRRRSNARISRNVFRCKRARSTQHFIITSLIIAFFFIGITAAQDAPTITLDEPQTVTLNADAPAMLIYSAEESHYITVTTRAISGGDDLPDTVLEVLTLDYERLAYDDDTVFVENGEIVIQRDAQLPDLLLPEPGDYRIRVDSFNGVSEGEVEVLVTLADKFTPTIETDENTTTIQARLPLAKVFTYDISVEAGEQLTLTARDATGAIDPVLRLLDESGAIIAENDDHQSDDLRLNAFAARIAGYNVDADGVLTVQVFDFMGREGSIEIWIEGENSQTSP